MWFFWWLLTVSFLKFIDMISWMTKTNEVRFLRSLDELDPITQNMKSWTFYWLMECFIMKNIKFHLEYIFVQSPDKMCMELFRFYLIYAIKCHFTWPLLTWHGQYVSCISSKYGYWWSWWLMKFANASLIYHIATCVTKYFAVVK